MNMIALGRNILDHVNMLLISSNLALYIDICIEQKYEIWPWNQNMIVKLFESDAYNDPNWVSLWDISKLNYLNIMRKIQKFKKKKCIEIQRKWWKMSWVWVLNETRWANPSLNEWMEWNDCTKFFLWVSKICALMVNRPKYVNK